MTKVLIAEDTPLNMELIIDIFKAMDFIVHEASNGEEAVKMTGEEQYDLIIMDIEMPIMDGITATKLIKSNPAYANVPIVALSAFAMKGDREKFLSQGCDDYISKPIDVLSFMKNMEKYKK
ncbi:MAG: response regulator [Candidatus Methanoperedens sp.]|nr:response regulator [Candidatus Methanoperedens sp.]